MSNVEKVKVKCPLCGKLHECNVELKEDELIIMGKPTGDYHIINPICWCPRDEEEFLAEIPVKKVKSGVQKKLEKGLSSAGTLYIAGNSSYNEKEISKDRIVRDAPGIKQPSEPSQSGNHRKGGSITRDIRRGINRGGSFGGSSEK